MTSPCVIPRGFDVPSALPAAIAPILPPVLARPRGDPGVFQSIQSVLAAVRFVPRRSISVSIRSLRPPSLCVPAVLAPVANIVAPVPDIVAAVEPILGAIATIFAPVPDIFGPVAERSMLEAVSRSLLCRHRRGSNQEAQSRRRRQDHSGTH